MELFRRWPVSRVRLYLWLEATQNKQANQSHVKHKIHINRKQERVKPNVKTLNNIGNKHPNSRSKSL